MKHTSLASFVAFVLLSALVSAETPLAPAPSAIVPVDVDDPEVVAENKAKAQQLDKLAANPDMVKGELGALGVTKLQTKNTRIGVRLGTNTIGSTIFAVGTLDFDLMVSKLGVGLSVPLRVPIYDQSQSFSNALLIQKQGLTLREEDWDELSEILRVIRFIRWGGKEQRLYVNIGTESPATIGHGNLVRRYMANVDVNRGRVSGEVDWYGDYAGFEMFVGDLLAPQNMVSAMAFLKPFGGSSTQWLKSLSVGATFAADFAAPYRLARLDGPGSFKDLPQLDTSTSSVSSPLVAETRAAQLVGVSIETKVVKTESADVKPYLELSQLTGGGSGVSLGGLGRFSWGKQDESQYALRVVGELRAFQGNFLPGYFDTFYEIQKYQFLKGGLNDVRADRTKLEEVLSRAPDLKLGYYAEAQIAKIDSAAFTAAFEDSQAEGGRNLVLHVEVPTWERLRFFGSLHRRGIDGNPFAFDSNDPTSLLNANNTLVFAGARLRILPILYLNARAFRSWKMTANPEKLTGVPASVLGFENVTGFDLDVELGYEFTRE